MPQFAIRLSAALGKVVLDRTGLEGSFDFKVANPAGETPADLISGILASLKGLGLKLDAGTGPVEMLVIEQAEKPARN
jgi:uncharacterized protein (TIGR03435 family)